MSTRFEDWTRRKDPSERVHTETAFPPASAATWGSKASPGVSETASTAPNDEAAPAGRVAALIRSCARSATHTATALPDESIETCGDKAPKEALEIVSGGVVPGFGKLPPAGRNAALILFGTHEAQVQTATAFPLGSVAIWGSKLLSLAAEIVCAVPQTPEDARTAAWTRSF